MEDRKITITHEQFVDVCGTAAEKQMNIRGGETDDSALALYAVILELELFGTREDESE